MFSWGKGVYVGVHLMESFHSYFRLCYEIFKLSIIECFLNFPQVEIFIWPLYIYLWNPVPEKGRICQIILYNSHVTVSLYLMFYVVTEVVF